MKDFRLISAFLCCAWLTACAAGSGDLSNRHTDRAAQALDSLYKCYAVPGTALLRESHPFIEDYTAIYLPTEQQDGLRPKEFAYLWPFSGTFSGLNALYEATGSEKYLRMLEETVLPGLEEYCHIDMNPFAYSSYVNSAPKSGRFYDDNVWIGIEFTNLYRTTGKEEYLSRAEELWRFVMSGRDEVSGDGIYWCEQNRVSKNACSNAPASVFALKLHRITGKPEYLDTGRKLYRWTSETLKDTVDNLYMDNIDLAGNVDSLKYSYNSGQMVQAGALLYEITGEADYLEEARLTARAVFDRYTYEFQAPGVKTFRMPDNGTNIWFTAVTLRGFCELYRIDRDRKYIDNFITGLDYAWEHGRDSKGLFCPDWSGKGAEGEKWLLNQGAVVEMLARIANIDG